MFSKPGDPFPGCPYSPYMGVPHHIKNKAELEAWQEKAKQEKKNCVDFGKCNECLNGTCRIIRLE
jgi:hypothetical protein